MGWNCANAVRWALSMVGVAVGWGVEAAGDEQLASTTSSNDMIRSQRCFIQCIAVLLSSLLTEGRRESAEKQRERC